MPQLTILKEGRFAAALLLVGFGTPINASPVFTDNLRVTLLTCPQALGSPTTVSVRLIGFEDTSTAGTIPLSELSEGYYVGTASVTPGHYRLLVQDGPCETGARITVLPNHDRNLVLVARRYGRPIYDFEDYLAGSLPMRGIERAFITNSHGNSIPLTIDGNAYYGEGLPDGDYTLNIALSYNLVSRFHVRIARPGAIVNIDAGDLRRSLGKVTKYADGSEVFQALWSHLR